MTIIDADLRHAKAAMWAGKEFLTWRDLLLSNSPHFKLQRVVWDPARQCCSVIYTKPPGRRGKASYVAEAIQRMVAIRSRRRDPETGNLRPVIDEWWKLLRLNYQPLFNRCSSGQLVGDGWVDLTLAMADWIWGRGGDDLTVRFDDFASRDGGLSVDVTGYNDVQHLIVEAIEWLSNHVCEYCGSVGRSRGGDAMVPSITCCDSCMGNR